MCSVSMPTSMVNQIGSAHSWCRLELKVSTTWTFVLWVMCSCCVLLIYIRIRFLRIAGGKRRSHSEDHVVTLVWSSFVRLAKLSFKCAKFVRTADFE
ncbi:MAG: hypothetical protein ACKESB_00630 [Candidatus Hodgkinia cicadicola]